jgi:hypothetical protein
VKKIKRDKFNKNARNSRVLAVVSAGSRRAETTSEEMRRRAKTRPTRRNFFENAMIASIFCEGIYVLE